MSPKSIVSALFQKWENGDSSEFFAVVADNVTWTEIGQSP